MAEGTLGMVVCPILEDELVYNLLNDSQEKYVLVLRNPYSHSIEEKLSKARIKYETVAESAFMAGDFPLPKEGYNVVIWHRDMGLHREPEDLGVEIKKNLIVFQEQVDAIMLYYGLCGQGLKGIEEWGSENLSVPITIMKDSQGKVCDDCICVPVGGTDNYLKLLRKYPGVMYLTPGVACSHDEFLKSMEFFRGVEETTDEMFKMLLEMADYKYALKIQTGLGDQENFQASAEEFCRKFGLELIYLDEGWVNTEVADLTYKEAKEFLKAR